MNDELKNLQIYSEAQQASKANTSIKSQSHKAKEAWIKKGNKLALCVNDGCNRCVEVRSWSIGGKPSIKSECRSCSYARKSNKALEGITFHKKNYCENVDGFLGFKCRWTTDINDPDPACCFELDHLDGNHWNNTPENVKTLCCMCHRKKTALNKDADSTKDSSLRTRKN